MRGLCLTGGGARGAWQAGALLRAVERGAKWDLVTGTSVGAVNLAGLGCVGAETLAELWLAIEGKRDVMRLNWPMPYFWDGFNNFGPLRSWLGRVCQGDSAVKGWVTHVDTRTLAVGYTGIHDTPREKFLDAVIGSCVVVGMQSPFNGLVDGGHREFAPVQKLIMEGATEIDVISTSPLTEQFEPESKPVGMFPILWNIGRGIAALAHEVWLRDLEQARSAGVKIRVYAPKYALPDPMDYSHRTISESFVMGYGYSHDK